MELNTFVRGVLVNIAQGVKEANSELKMAEGVSSFALKNAGWYVDPSNGSIWFSLFVDSKSGAVRVLENEDGHSNAVNKITFNVVQTYAIS